MTALASSLDSVRSSADGADHVIIQRIMLLSEVLGNRRNESVDESFVSLMSKLRL